MSNHEANVSYHPTEGLTYDPNDERYWDPALLGQELTRVFEVCHGCRMCFKYCDSFPTLFKLIDEKHDGDVRRITAEETATVMDACFQCKLCEVQCPYTPRDSHPFQLDFPKLVHRTMAQRVERQGVPLRDRVLGDPDGTAAFARASFGLANVMNRVKLHRWFMEKTLGIHRDKLLPDFARKTFEARVAEAGRLLRGPGDEEAVLFQTCFVEHNDPQIGLDTLEVLDRNSIKAGCVEGLRCCGMPAWEHGDLDRLREHAHHNLERLRPYAEAGKKILVINPTCSMMLRREYPDLVDPHHREAAEVVAGAIMDPSEMVWSIRNEERFNTDVKTRPASVAYHAPCHLRAQAVGFKGRDLMRKIFGVTPGTVMECCGHDGTYAMKVEGFEASARVGKRAFDDMKDKGAEVWSTDCPLAALQFHQHAGHKGLHPMTVLARAYRGEPLVKEDEETEP